MYREASEEWYEENSSCPICSSSCYKKDEPITLETRRTQPTWIVCPTCGRFCITTDVRLHYNEAQIRPLAYKLSLYLRSISERATGKNDESSFLKYECADLKRITESRDPSVNEKLQMLLKHLAGLSEYPGQQIQFDSKHDYSVLCAKNMDEAIFYLRALAEQGLVLPLGEIFKETPCALTSSGWQELEKIERSGAESSNAFIAMWFDPSQNAVRGSIQSAIAASGYVPIRIDEVEHVNRIDDEIIARIRQSKFVVADFTGQRNGVYFEAGFMLGLGRPVVWLCNKSEIDKVHFDTRQYNTIVYADVEELKSKLQFRIEAIMGKGPHVAEVSPAHHHPTSLSPKISR